MAANSVEEAFTCSKQEQQEKFKVKPQQEQPLNCPRCDSINTKFCYYNNYSLSQPRYFCKGCKRYWTQGGTLRNVPVGGGCRRNKRPTSSTSSSSSSSSSKRIPDHQVHISTNSHQIPTNFSDLSLAFARLHNTHQPTTMQLGFHDHHENSMYGNHMNTTTTTIPYTLLTNNNHGGGVSQSMYNVFGNEDLGEVLSSGGGEEVGFPPYEEMCGSTTATTVATTKQDFCRGRDGEIINRGFWNFPWQNGGGEGSLGGAVDAGREYWSGLGSSWQGLVNSPLM
ncbi:hypothetical protein ACHQM5_021735 [Ranunculus cassubicifolius]